MALKPISKIAAGVQASTTLANSINTYITTTMTNRTSRSKIIFHTSSTACNKYA